MIKTTKCSTKTAFFHVVVPDMTAIATEVGIERNANKENALSQYPMFSAIDGMGLLGFKYELNEKNGLK